MNDKMTKRELNQFPWLILFISVIVWVLMAGANFYIQENHFFTGTGLLFPISVVYPNAFLWSSFLFGILFVLLGILSFRYVEKLNFYLIFILCVVLVLLGNLAQGNFEIAFLEPFYLKGRQYYTDAVEITNGELWLRNFSQNLEFYQLHTKTHPPFITLLHYWILSFSNLETLAIIFFTIGCLSFPLFSKILFYLGFDESKRKWLIILIAVVPAVNVYLLVSIDALVLTFSLLVLLGLSRIIYKKKIDLVSFLFIVFGLLLTNLISFSGLFLFMVLGIVSLVFMLKGKFGFFWLSVMSGLVFILSFLLLFLFTDYNHLEVFSLASASENPNGFRLFHQPMIYLFTRLEDIAEILMFLSFGFLALLFSKKEGTELFSDSSINLLFWSAVSTLLIMFLTGAYGTGETARACLFVVPYFLILLKNVKISNIKVLFCLTLLQTTGMQMIANFYW